MTLETRSTTMSYGLSLILMLAICTQASVGSVENDEDVVASTASDLELRAKEFLQRLNEVNLGWWRRSVLADWAYETNITEETLNAYNRILVDIANYTKDEQIQMNAFPWQHVQDYSTRRQLSIYAESDGALILSDEEYEEFTSIVGNMTAVYSSATVCDYRNATKCDLDLNTDLFEIFRTSRDAEELKYYWIEWRKASGEKIRPIFPRYVQLINKAARLNNFTDASAAWLSIYKVDNFTDHIASLWGQLKPFYLELHAYVRSQLVAEYGEDIVSREGPIPAHLLGNMWAQEWEYVANFSSPYPGQARRDPTVNMIAQGYDAERIFRLADSFYASLNLSAVPDTFWNRSILEKPNDGREIVCQPIAWNFLDGEDFRVKMCTAISYEDLLVAHSQMGYIQYYIQFKDQPPIFLDYPNPGFGAAVGDTIGLSVSTTKHLKLINLLDDDVEEDPKEELNYLYEKALEWLPLLAFALTLEEWRFRVFRGEITPENYNAEWWRLANDVQGIKPPVDRTEEELDPASKYHIAANVDYLRYFVGIVLQYQFYDTLCQVSGQYDPNDATGDHLHKCDFYQSTSAGNRLGSMLRMGRSRPWQDVLEMMTGQRVMDATGFLDYFKPLREWLEAKNIETAAYVGWPDSTHIGA